MIPSAHDMRRVSDHTRRCAHNPAFDHVLSKAANVVREAAKRKFGSVAYKIPDYVQGYPVYRFSACFDYLAEVFEAKGFEVRSEAGNVIVLIWAAPDPPARAAPMDGPDGDAFSRLVL